jgi:hypothetical protein
MTDDDAQRLADAAEPLRVPAPPDVMDRLNTALLTNTLGQLVETERPDLVDALYADRLAVGVEDFDSEGWTTVSVVWKGSGMRTDCGMQAHWSALVRPD